MLHVTRKLLELAFVSLIQLLSLSRADYELQVEAVSYANPSGRRFDGDCCDFSLISCRNDCDTHLEFCFRPPGYSDAFDEDCPLGILTAGSVGDDTITFGDSIGQLSNPFAIHVEESWLGSFQILVEVYDTDDITDDDFIDLIFVAPFNLSVGNSLTRTYSGQRASITLTFQVTCSSYYYGTKCDVFCEETDSAVKGHYTCDPRTGEKVCRPGYMDPASNCITASAGGTLEPVTTTTTVTATTADTSQAGGGTDAITMETATISTTAGSPDHAGTSTVSVFGILGSSSTTLGAPSVNPDVNSAANKKINKRNNIGVIAGPLVASIVVITTIIVALIAVLICKRYRNSSKSVSSDDLTERMLSTFDDGIPNATYDPRATGVVYAGTNTERDFKNPLYHSARFTHTGQSGAAANNPTMNGGHSNDEDNDSKSSSGLYSTIDHRLPNRIWALRPPESVGQYSVITDPH